MPKSISILGSNISDKTSDNEEHHDSLSENLMRVHKEGRDVFKYYEITKVLGEGSMGAVSLVRKKYEGRTKAKPRGLSGLLSKLGGFADATPAKAKGDYLFAMKTIQMSRVSPEFIEELRNEISILRSLDHPNIVKAYDVFEKKRQIYIIMECCTGGDLYARIPYTEAQAAEITKNILSAISYMHENGVVHRDLKYENIMFENDSIDAQIKILDYGLSKKFKDGEEKYMTEGVGTIYTMAPQVLQGVYTSQADLWSIGVITYMLISRQKPFYHKRRKGIVAQIMKCQYDFPEPRWSDVSPEAKEFISKLLVMDPTKRMNAQQALKHKWLTEIHKDATAPKITRGSTDGHVADSLFRYKENNVLKKMALMVIAHRSTADEICELREVFDKYDTLKNGVITWKEFKEALKDGKYSDEEIMQIFHSLDVDDDGCIEYTEFIAATLETSGHIQREKLAEAFDRLDSDDSGFITPKNLRDMLGADYKPEMVEEIMESCDTNHDGKICFEEFLGAFKRISDPKIDDHISKILE